MISAVLALALSAEPLPADAPVQWSRLSRPELLSARRSLEEDRPSLVGPVLAVSLGSAMMLAGAAAIALEMTARTDVRGGILGILVPTGITTAAVGVLATGIGTLLIHRALGLRSQQEDDADAIARELTLRPR